MHTVEDVINGMGGPTKLADDLGIRVSNLSHWKTNGYITPAHAIEIEKLSKGKYKAVKMPTKPL